MDNQAKRTLWLLLHDRDFLRTHARSLDISIFPPGPVKYLVGLACRNWTLYRSLTTPSALAQALDVDYVHLRQAKTEAATAAAVYLELEPIEDEALPYMRAVCTAWLEQYAVGAAIEKASDAWERGDLSGARDSLSLMWRGQGNEEETFHLIEDWTKLQEEETIEAVPLGLPELDRLWRGGIRPQELGIILAPTNIGKSMAAAGFAAEAWWRNKDVLYYSFELTPMQVGLRILTGILHKGPETLGARWELDQEVAQAASRRHRRIPPTAMMDVKPGEGSIRGVIHTLEDYHEKRGKYPDLLILDSADDLQPERRRERGWEESRDLFTTIRSEVAQALEIAVWTTAQATRDAIDKARISLKHTGGAIAKAQRAHYTLGLAQSDNERNDPNGPFMNLYVLKDTLHGTRGGWLLCRPFFGFGEDGYPGFEVEQTHGLPVSLRKGGI